MMNINFASLLLLPAPQADGSASPGQNTDPTAVGGPDMGLQTVFLAFLKDAVVAGNTAPKTAFLDLNPTPPTVPQNTTADQSAPQDATQAISQALSPDDPQNIQTPGIQISDMPVTDQTAPQILATDTPVQTDSAVQPANWQGSFIQPVMQDIKDIKMLLNKLMPGLATDIRQNIRQAVQAINRMQTDVAPIPVVNASQNNFFDMTFTMPLTPAQTAPDNSGSQTTDPPAPISVQTTPPVVAGKNISPAQPDPVVVTVDLIQTTMIQTPLIPTPPIMPSIQTTPDTPPPPVDSTNQLPTPQVSDCAMDRVPYHKCPILNRISVWLKTT